MAKRNGRGKALLGGVGLGAGLMWVCDPARGRRRRVMMRDKAVRTVHELRDAVDTGARDLAHRLIGLVAETRGRLHPEDVPDDVLTERVRARLGRHVSHPHAIEVSSSGGRIVLRGPILAREVDSLLKAIRKVRGVVDVESRLDAHQTAEGIPSLQGGGRRPGVKAQIFQEVWAPRTRLVFGTVGAVATVGGLRRGGIFGLLAAAPGAAVFLRAITNMPMKRVFGVAGGRRGFGVQKTIEVSAPLEEVFRYCTNLESWPRFMEHVKQVTVSRKDPMRSHWIVKGPAGIAVDWEAEITRFEENRQIAWKSAPGSTVEHAGVLRFDAMPDGRTRIDVKLTYNPPGGVIGHTLAALFGTDPKHALDDDLIRLKSLLEAGKATAHGHEVRRDDIAPPRTPIPRAPESTPPA